jgi:SET domain-containing protein
MLVIKTKLGLSSKRGIGLFSDQDILKGTVVGLNNDNLGIIRYTEKQWEELESNLSEESFKHIKIYTYKNKDDGLYWLNLDNTRFINHSEDPNIAIMGDNDTAIKDIKKGEEILIDYTTFYNPDYFQEIMKLS